MGEPYLHYCVFRTDETSSEEIIRAVIEETKNYVFDESGILLESQGYSGVNLVGRSSMAGRRDDLWKIVDVFFRLTQQFQGLLFSISTEDESQNLFYRECERNEVLPKWTSKPEDFNHRVYGCGGVLHVVSPQIKAKHPPNTLNVDIVRSNPRDTRNILITEAVKQRISLTSSRGFGMQQTSVNLPESVAYIAKQRPDLLSEAIREYFKRADGHRDAEEQLEDSNHVMVHVYINSRDWKAVTAVADIESPNDIVSHLIGIAMLEFDAKYSACQNGALDEEDETFKQVSDNFERERLSSLYAALKGVPQSLAHRYQMAKALVTSKHKAECKKLFADGNSSSNDAPDTACSGDDELDVRKIREEQQKNKVLKKKRDAGKKRHLAAPIPKKGAPSAPMADDDEPPTPTRSGQLRNFERAVNGDDVYKESSDEKSLGEEEDLDMFSVKTKSKKAINLASPRSVSDNAAPQSDEDDGGFDVSDLIHAAPPLAENDEEDFDDI